MVEVKTVGLSWLTGENGAANVTEGMTKGTTSLKKSCSQSSVVGRRVFEGTKDSMSSTQRVFVCDSTSNLIYYK